MTVDGSTQTRLDGFRETGKEKAHRVGWIQTGRSCEGDECDQNALYVILKELVKTSF